MTWKRCDGCNRAIAANAENCDYCGHVFEDNFDFLRPEDNEQEPTPWPSETAAAPVRPPTGLPPLELNDQFPFAHVFDSQAASAPAAAPKAEKPDTDAASSGTLSSMFPLNDSSETEYQRTRERLDPLTLDEQGAMDRLFDTPAAEVSPGMEHVSPAPVVVEEWQRAAVSSAAPEPWERGHHVDPVAVDPSDQRASPVPVAAASSTPAGKLGTRKIAMMGGALFAAAGLIFTILSMRGAASPEPAAASAPATPRTQARLPSPASARAKTPGALPAVLPKWSVVTEGRWIGLDRKTVAFELQAVNKIHIWTRDVTPVLVVRCQGGHIEPFVFTQSAARMESQDEDHTVRVAFDDGPEATERWPDSVDHDALFARDANAFTQQLASSHTLKFGFTPHNAEPAVTRFAVAGISDLLASAPRQCGWKR